jgi:hypothetical protein
VRLQTIDASDVDFSRTAPEKRRRTALSREGKTLRKEKTVMSNNKVTKIAMAQRVRDLIAGTQKHPPSGQLTLVGQSFTKDSLIQFLQNLENAMSKADEAKAAWDDALAALADVKAKMAPTLRAYRSWITATYGNAPATLAAFGVEPPKARTPLTAGQAAAAVAKRTATRTARHTLGPRQKAGIKGDVKVDVVTTPLTTSPATPAPAAVPAAAPAPAKVG